MTLTPPYKPVTDAIVSLLRQAAGDDNVQIDDEAREIYASDETEDLSFPPEVVVHATSSDAVSRVMAVAWGHDIPVTPRGGGTGLSGGALPVHGGIALSTERMNRIVEIDRSNLIAVVEPGVITQELQEAAEKVGLYYPPDPASGGSSCIGGNLAESAGGPHAIKYGSTKDYVLGIEAVLPDGTVFHHGGKLLKNATGYNLTQLIIGSEGTLAVITKVFLKLIPLPRYRLTLFAPFQKRWDGAQLGGQLRFGLRREGKGVGPQLDQRVVSRPLVRRGIALIGPDRCIEGGVARPGLEHADVEVESVHLGPHQVVVDLVPYRPATRVDRGQPALIGRQLLVLLHHCRGGVVRCALQQRRPLEGSPLPEERDQCCMAGTCFRSHGWVCCREEHGQRQCAQRPTSDSGFLKHGLSPCRRALSPATFDADLIVPVEARDRLIES